MQARIAAFMLSAKPYARAAERFFCKALKSSHNQEPRVINVDTVDIGRGTPAPNNLTADKAGGTPARNCLKNAAYPPAIDKLTADQTLPKTTELRRVKYFNNIVELSASIYETIGQSRDGVCFIQYSEVNIERVRGNEHDS